MKAKSKAVKELIDLIYTNPEIFKAEDEDSLCSDNYRMTCMFGFFLLPFANLYINNISFKLCYKDGLALEAAYSWWRKNIPLTSYSGKVN